MKEQLADVFLKAGATVGLFIAISFRGYRVEVLVGARGWRPGC